MEVRSTGCCAVKELVDISTEPTPEAVLREAIHSHDLPNRKYYTKGQSPFIFFTSVVERHAKDHTPSMSDTYGQDLADYIKQERLGEVITTLPPQLNYTGNIVKVWLWMPNYGALWAWDDEHTRTAGQMSPATDRIILNHLEEIGAIERATLMGAEVEEDVFARYMYNRSDEEVPF